MCSHIDFERNIELMAAAIHEAEEAGACFYFAPEMSILLDRDRKRAVNNIFSESESQALKFLQHTASKTGMWIHIGSMAVHSEIDQSLFANRSIVIDNKGNLRARYDKIHLFDVKLKSGEIWAESSAYVPGHNAVVANTPLGPMGLTICYDLRFPDLYSALSKAGVNILAIPAAFTVPTGQAHWHSLLRARAIEAEAFVVAAAQSGKHEDGRETYGHSLVVDPWGEILLDMGKGEGLGFAEIDLVRIQEVRAQIPVHTNRRDIAEVIIKD